MPPPREVSNPSASDSDDSSNDSSSSSSGSQTTSRSGTSTTVTATTTGTGTGTTTTTTTSGNKRVSFQKGKSGNRSTASRTTTGTTATTGTGTTTATSTSGTGTGDSGSSDSDDETTNTTSQTATNGGPNMRTTTASGSDSSSDDSDTDSDSDSSGSDSTDDSSDSGTESATSARTGTSGTTTGTGTTRTSGTGTSRSTKTGTSTTSGTSKTTSKTHTTSGSSKTTSSSKTNTTQTSTGTTGTSGTSGTSKTTSSSATKTSNTSGTTTSSGAKSSTSGRDKLDQTATGATTTDANNESVTESTTSTTSSTRTGTGSTMTSTSDRTGTTSSRTPHTPRSASNSVRDASSSQANTARDLKIPKIIIPDPPKREDILKNGSMSQVPQGTTPRTPRGTAKFPSVSTPTIIPEGAKEALADNTGTPLEGANGANGVAIKGSDGGESKTDSKEGSRYDGVNESTSTESSTIRTVDGSVENSPSRMPVTTLQSRVVRKEIGIAAATNVIRTDKLPLAYMIRYRSSLDYVHSVLGSIAAAHFEKEKDLAEADKTPSGSLMASVARSTLRSFGVDEASIKSDCGDLKHLTLPLVQASIERSLLKRIPTLFMQKFKKIDDCQSGEVSLLECNRLLINSKIGACSVGEHSKVTVKLALFRRSLGVSVQQFSDQAEYFDLAPSANFRISVNTGNNDVIINDTYTISNLVTAEKDQLVQSLHACGHIRGLVDAFTLAEDQQVCYEPLVMNLMCHPRGWVEAAAVSSELKSLFRERLVATLVNPSGATEGPASATGNEPHQDPFLLSTLKTHEQRQSAYFPAALGGDGAIERPAVDTTKIYATIKFSEVRLPNEKIPVNSPFYLLVSLVTEQREIVTAARVYASRQKKPSDIWTFPKGEDIVSVFGSASDVVCVEICHSSSASKETSWENAAVEAQRRRGLETSVGFSSTRLDGIEHGASAMVVSGGTIYERTIKRGADEKEKSGLLCCTTSLASMRILTENTVGRPKSFPNQESLPARFVIEDHNLELLALCREAIFHRAEKTRVHGTAHVLHIKRDHIVTQSLAVVEDSGTMSALATLWKSIYKKFQRDQKSDLSFVYQQLLLLMTKISAAKNCVVNSEEIPKLVKGESQILLQTLTPLKPLNL